METKIAVRNFNFYYGSFHALKNINLDIPANKVTAFIGPSGDALVQGTSHEGTVAGAVVEPVEKVAHQTGVLSSRPGRKFWNRTQTSS